MIYERRSGFIFSGIALLLILPAIILAASLVNTMKTGDKISHMYISINRVSSGGEAITAELRDSMNKIASVSTLAATKTAIRLSFYYNKPIPSYAQPYFDSEERAFKPGKSIEFIRNLAITGLHEGKSSDFDGMNELLRKSIENYTHFTGLSITVYNPEGDQCTQAHCEVFNADNVEIVPAPFGMYTLVNGTWYVVIRDVSSNITWNLSIEPRYTINFNSSGGIVSKKYIIKSYVSIVGLQDPLIWWVLSKWSTAFRLGAVKEEAPDITTWPILRSPTEFKRIGNKEVNKSNITESFLNSLGSDIVNVLYHPSKYGPTFFDMLEARWWISKYYKDKTPLASSGEHLDVGMEVFIPNDPLNIENSVTGIRYSSVYHYYFSSFFSKFPYYSYIINQPPYKNIFKYNSQNLYDSRFSPPSLIWNGYNFTEVVAKNWNSSALNNVYIYTTKKEDAYSFLISHDIYMDNYTKSGYDTEIVSSAVKYNLTWAIE